MPNNSQSSILNFQSTWSFPYKVEPEFPYHLKNTEDQHLFILNKTAWAYFACQNPEGVLERAKKQGVNVLRVALEGRPHFNALGLDLWPWGGTRQNPEWELFNEDYWKQVKERVQLAGEQGIGLDLVLYFSLHPKAKQIPQQQPYWQEILHRLGKYANILTWEIANEYVWNPKFQDAAGRFFKENDPHHRPVCTSNKTSWDAIWPRKEWMDLAIVHTCTSSSWKHPLRWWYLPLARRARKHGKPVFCNESGREERHGNNDGVHRRKQGWLWCMTGGFWTWHSWDGCEGIDEADYEAPGAEFLKPMADFFRSLSFWKLEPATDLISMKNRKIIYTVLADADQQNICAYFCTGKTGCNVDKSQIEINLPIGDYQLFFIHPSDLKEIESRQLSLNSSQTLTLPQFQDDLVLKIQKL